ncbi:MAG: hypothetical protein JWM05_1466, partial [Acidimicrobiales bacterium]|nr:hypothetical protein [Acidimicrobiales bacterium]
MATDQAELDPPGAVELGATPPPVGVVGRSSTRRTVGLAGQYAVLVALALLVLAPVVLTLIQALSQLFRYVDAGKPPHPVAVIWKQRTWWSGGPVSVVGRTLLVALALAWLQLRCAGGTLRTVRVLGTPRRLAAIVVGTLALGIATGPVFRSLTERSGDTALWVVVAIAVVAATQAVGLWEQDRAPWRVALLTILSGVGLVAVAVVTAGADAWTRAWTNANLGPAMGRSFLMT